MNVVLQEVMGGIACNGSTLKLDQACIHIFSSASSKYEIWKQVDECHECKFSPWLSVPSNGSVFSIVDTKYPVSLYLSDSHNDICCQTTYRLEEYGFYSWNFSDKSCGSLITLDKPSVPYIAIIGAFLIFLGIALMWNLGKIFSKWIIHLRERNQPFSELESDLGSPSSTDGPSIARGDVIPAVRRQRHRVISLDVFRGICIAIMIFVNYGGGQYWFFKHSVWNGLTVADLVFPWFLWIMGVSLVISLRSQLRSALRRSDVIRKVMRRSLILICLGLLLNTVSSCKRTDISRVRLPGVLQRIGLAYLIVGSMEALMLKPQGTYQYGRLMIFQDVFDAWKQWLIVVSLASIHVVLSLLLPVPGCPRGYLGPGGLDMTLTREDIYFNCTGGAAGYIDRLIFGSKHIYQTPTFRIIYQTILPFDPEGLLGILTVILNVYLGVQAGRILLSYHYTISRVLRWSLWGIFCGIAGGVLCCFSKDDGWIPVNKNLWSLSFVLVTSSFAFFFLSLLYLTIDARKWWSGSPFLYAGMNSILLYVGHELAKGKFPWSWQPYYHTHAELLAMDLWGTCLWLLIAFILYKKDIFLSV